MNRNPKNPPPTPVGVDHQSEQRGVLPQFHYDVIVVGGGVSGSVAAIASARCGVRVLLVEEHGFLGGSLTAMGVGPMMTFHNPSGEQMVRGIPDEIIVRL